MTFLLLPRTVAFRFFGVVLFLSAMNVFVQVIYYTRGGYGDFGEYWDVGIEGNIPTLYSAVAILISATLVWLHGLESRRSGDGLQTYWFVLAAVMAFLGVDEATAIHEQLTSIVALFVEREGFLYFPWVIPYSALAAVFGLLYVRFLLALPRPTSRLFVAAAAVYIGGAVLVEMVSARTGQLQGTSSLPYAVLYSIEEFLEMTGIVIFIYALLRHGAAGREAWTIRIARAPAAL